MEVPTTGELLKQLEPTISSVVASYGGTGDPVMRSKARTLAVKAIKSYDPGHGASMATWVTQQLRPLARIKRQSQSILAAPENKILGGYAIKKFTDQFLDETGREPTLDEIQDGTGFNRKRIESIRQSQRAINSDSVYQENTSLTAPGQVVDHLPEAMDNVYSTLGLADKIIMERRFGYGGAEEWPTPKILEELSKGGNRATDVQLSRRTARLKLRITKALADLDAVYGDTSA